MGARGPAENKQLKCTILFHWRNNFRQQSDKTNMFLFLCPFSVCQVGWLASTYMPVDSNLFGVCLALSFASVFTAVPRYTSFHPHAGLNPPCAWSRAWACTQTYTTASPQQASCVHSSVPHLCFQFPRNGNSLHWVTRTHTHTHTCKTTPREVECGGGSGQKTHLERNTMDNTQQSIFLYPASLVAVMYFASWFPGLEHPTPSLAQVLDLCVLSTVVIDLFIPL
jgi:hypothetical protein